MPDFANPESDWTIPVSMGSPGPNWLDSMFSTGTAGGMVTNALSDDPYIRLRRKLAQDRTAYMQRKRAADDAVLPTVIQDYKQGIERTQALEQRIDLALSTLGGQTPPSMEMPQVGQADQYAQALVGLLAPGALPEVQGHYQKQAAEKSAMDFENSLRAYGLTRETAKIGLQRLMSQLDVEQGRTDNLYRTKTQIAERQAQGDLEAEQFFAGQERDIDVAEVSAMERRGLEEIAAGGKAETMQAQERERVRTNLEQSITSFNTKVQQARAAYQGILPDDLSKEYKAQYARLRESMNESGFVDLPELEPVMSRQTASGAQRDEDQKARREDRAYRQEQDRQAQNNWFVRGQAEGWLSGTPENPIPQPNYKDKKAKQDEFGKLQTAINEAKRETSQKMLIRSQPLESQEEDKQKSEKVKRENELWQALRAEYDIVMEKRVKFGGERIRLSEYLAQAYPHFAEEVGQTIDPKFKLRPFSPFSGQIGNTGTGTKPTTNAKTKVHDGWVYELRKDGWHPVRKA